MDRFTQNLRRARKAAGLTQQQLADRLHVTRQSVSSWELGRTEPDLQTLTDFLVEHMSNENWPPEQARAYFAAKLPELDHWKAAEN